MANKPVPLDDLPDEYVAQPKVNASAVPMDDLPDELLPQEPASPSMMDNLGRQAGLTARIGIEGASDIGGMVINSAQKLGEEFINATPLGKPLGMAVDAIQNQFNPNGQKSANEFSQTMQNGGTRVADMLGLPKPENAAERVVNTTGRLMAPTGAVIKGANMAANATMSPAKKRIMRFLSADPGIQALGTAGAGLGSSTVKEMGGGEGMQIAGGVLGGLGLAAGASTVNKALNTGSLSLQPTEAIGRTVKQKTAQEAIDSGYVLPPSNTESGMVSKVLEGVSGKEKTSQLASVKNQQVTDNYAKDYIKLPRTQELTTETLNGAKQPHFEVYEEIGKLPAIKRLGGVKGEASMNGKEALEALKTARYDAKMQWNYFNRSGDPEAFAKAQVLDKQAQTYEKQLEGIAMYAKKPELVNQLRESRKELAKIYTVEKSLNPETGHVDAKVVAKLKEKGAPIDGELGKVAKTAKAFPDAMRVPKTGYANPLTAWDWTFGGLGSTVNPAATLIPASRIAARYGVLSKPGQRAINASKSKSSPTPALGLAAAQSNDDKDD